MPRYLLAGLFILALGPPRPSLAQSPDDLKVIAAIKSVGGRVQLEGQAPCRQVVGVDLSTTWVRTQDKDLKKLSGLQLLRSINLEYQEVTDAGVKEFIASQT